MPDLSITDSLGNPLDISTVRWTSASSLNRYLKTELLHLAVAPDFIAVKDKPLSQAAPKPTTFKLSVGHDFQLGNSAPEIDIKPGAEVELLINATSGSDFFDDDPFQTPVLVPALTAYAGISLQGSLGMGVSGSSGDLTFGIDRNNSITFEFVKAFQTGQGEPSLGSATAAVFSDFVIPACIEDLGRLNLNDVCCVSGDGSLQISGAVSVAVPVNPLASVNLPLSIGTLTVQDGVLTGLSASLTLSGCYQIRVQKLNDGSIRLSYMRERQSTLCTDLTASAGVSVNLKTTDILAKLLGAIGKGTVDEKVLDGLTPDEVETFTSMLKAGVDHSLQASIDLALSASTDHQIAFQYDLQPSQFDAVSVEAVNRAMKGDLSQLTALEDNAGPDGAICPGVKLLNSVFSAAKARGFSLKVNLLGIVNLISGSQLIGKCEFLFDPASGDLTIKETAASDRISAITDPYKRQQALCRAMFESVLVTTTYVVSKAVAMPALSCQAVHFATTTKADVQTIADYTNWFVALNLMELGERAGIVSHATGGALSTCVVRAPMDDACCEALFFDGQGDLRKGAEYTEIGRQALKALLDPAHSRVDQLRYNFLDSDATWNQALELGPGDQLTELIPLSPTDATLPVVLGDVSGDLYDIVWWADSMQKAGQALQGMRTFLSGRDPAKLATDPGFADRRDALQKLMLNVVGSSKVRFDEPWGLVCLYRAGGSQRASGRFATPTLTIERETPPAAVFTAARS